MSNGMHGVSYNADSLLGPAADLTLDPEHIAKVRRLLQDSGAADLADMVIGEVA